MKRHVPGSCRRIICFNVQATDGRSQHLSAEEKDCITFFEETIESIATGNDALSTDDSQSSGNTISENHHITHGTDQGRSSCDSFPVTGHSEDLSAEEKACLKLLEDAINSVEDGGLSTDDAKKAPIKQIKNHLVPTPFILAGGIGNITPKQGLAFSKEKTPADKDYSPQKDQPSPDDASHWGPLSCDDLMELCKRVKKHPYTHGDHMHSKNPQNISESPCSKSNPPAVAPKPKKVPSHIANLNHKGTSIPTPDSNLHCLSTSAENYGLIKPDKTKLEALLKLGLLKEDAIPESKQGSQGAKLERSVSDDKQSALQNLSRTLSISLPMVPEIDEDRKWALRKLGLLKD